MGSLRKTFTISLVTISIASLSAIASAAPVSDGLAIKRSAPATIEVVRHRGGSGGAWAGFAAGAIIGGLLAAPYYDPGYYPGPYYPGAYYPPVYYGPGPVGPGVAYCARRFRSYDPVSGTYVGNDGFRHACP